MRIMGEYIKQCMVKLRYDNISPVFPFYYHENSLLNTFPILPRDVAEW